MSSSMAENGDSGVTHNNAAGGESLMEKIADKLHHHHKEEDHHKDNKDHDSSSSSSSSSDSDTEKPKTTSSPSAPPAPPSSSSVKSKVNRLFGREKPVHQVLGGGKPADVLLWRNKKVSASVLGTATVIWVVFELLQCHLLSLISHILIFSLAVLFLWTNASTFIKSPPNIPTVTVPERPILEFVSCLTAELNRGLALLHSVATGKDLKKFLAVIAGLWLISILGKSCDFLTLFYINFVLLHTVPVLYEKYEDHVDTFAERAMNEGQKYYGVVNERYISKIPRGPLQGKKTN